MKTLGIITSCALLLGLSVALPALAQESRIELHSHFSSVLSTQKNFNVFLPVGYDQETAKYPVIYLFRGHEREWANPNEDGSRTGNIKAVADRLYDQGTIGKMIFVMPGLTGLPPVPSAEFSYVLDELIPYVDAHFRTIPARQQRGMDGFSMGGYDALHLLWRNPEAFITLGTYDGSFWGFDMSLFANAPESYWDRVRPMRFMIHSASGTSSAIAQFIDILGAHGVENSFDPVAISPDAVHNWYFADLHMERSLPLHWEHFASGSQNLPLSLLSPSPGAKISGEVPVRWSLATRPDSLQTYVEYSRDRGKSWYELYTSGSADTTFIWNTADVPDGTRYLLRVRVVGDTVYGFAESAGRFTVDNPGNGQPELELLSPRANEQLSGCYTLTWWAEDADSDPLQISLAASPDSGTTWEHLADVANTGSYEWDTRNNANSSMYRLRVRADDGQSPGEVFSAMFRVYNTRPMLQDTLVRHVAGSADGSIRVHAVDPAQITGHTYRVSFHDSIPGSKAYSVVDVDRAVVVVSRAPVSNPSRESPLFDGLRLVLNDFDPPRVSEDSTRWIAGVSNLVPEIFLPRIDPGTGMINGVPHVADYSVTLYDHTVDTSSSLFGWLPAPMDFTVWNVTEGHPVEVLFTDVDNNRSISAYDDLIFVERDSADQPYITWELFFAAGGSVIPPSSGDVFLLRILKPFTSKDVYEFAALPSGIVLVAAGTVPQPFRLEQNYPNPFNPRTVITYQLPFLTDVRVAVYDLLGREVAVLVNERKAPGSYEVTFDGTHLSSGVYLYRLQAENPSPGPLTAPTAWPGIASTSNAPGFQAQARGFVQTRKMILIK